MRFVVLFPGQGSQFIGMGPDLFAARPDLLGEETDRALGWPLRELCLKGPEEELTRTDRAQAALFALAFVLWEGLAAHLPGRPAGAAGHSLGEYTALAAAEAIDFWAALRLVATRGEAMARAAARQPSGMAALLGTDADRAEQIAAQRRHEGGHLFVANLNAPGQVVLAGGTEDLEWLEDLAGELGVRRVVRLNVSGAFHSPFMEPAAEELQAALGGVRFGEPAFPVWSNVTADPMRAMEIGDLLGRQLVSPVRFSETLENMAGAGIETFVHVGPGDTTAGMARRAVPGAEVLVVDRLALVEETAIRLGQTIE